MNNKTINSLATFIVARLNMVLRGGVILKREYDGLEAIRIPFNGANQIITASGDDCSKLYVTHHDTEVINNLCDEAEEWFKEKYGDYGPFTERYMEDI